jgi:hypothetical protein
MKLAFLALCCSLALASCGSGPEVRRSSATELFNFRQKCADFRKNFDGLRDSRFTWMKENVDARTNRCYLEAEFVPEGA